MPTMPEPERISEERQSYLAPCDRDGCDFPDATWTGILTTVLPELGTVKQHAQLEVDCPACDLPVEQAA